MSGLPSLSDGVDSLRNKLAAAQSIQDLQSVGHGARELLISAGQAVFDPAVHTSTKEKVSPTDAKEMLGAFVGHALPGRSNEESRRFVRAAVDLANAVQHDRAASYRDAALSVEACASVVTMLVILTGATLAVSEPWEGVHDGPRYFAWAGPTLHALDDRIAVPAPDSLLVELRAAGWTPRFAMRSKLTKHLAGGLHQVWETDRRSWRKEVLYSGDGDQVLLIAKDAA